MLTPPCNEQILTKTVIETGESEEMIRKVINHQIGLVVQVIGGGTMESVLIPEFGTFCAKPKRLYHTLANMAKPKTTVRK